MARTKETRRGKNRKKSESKAAIPTKKKISKKEKSQLKRKIKAKSEAEAEAEPSQSNPETLIETLLEPYSKDQLVNIAADVALTHNSFFALVKSTEDQDISHRKIFVHGLEFETTGQTLEPILGQFGALEDIHVVTDRSTGKCKGYAFVTFKSRKSAEALLKNPKFRVGSRTVSCQLASAGRADANQLQNFVPQQQNFAPSDYPERKIYVSNVPVNADINKLRIFFEKFGEIENGPKGYDPETGKFSRNYAIFVYKNVEGAKNVLKEQNKMFDGVKLYCRKAENKMVGAFGGAASITTALQPLQPQMLAAAATAGQQQNVGLSGNHLQAQAGLFNAGLGPLMGGYYGMMGLGMGLGGGIGNGVLPGGFGPGVIPALQYAYPNLQNLLGIQMAATMANPNLQGGIASMDKVSGPMGSADSLVGTGGPMIPGLQYPYPNFQGTHMAASLAPQMDLGSSGAASEGGKQALHNLFPNAQSGAGFLLGNGLGASGGGQLGTGPLAVQYSQPNVMSVPSLGKGSGTMGGGGYRPT